jgi:hypothetical protein
MSQFAVHTQSICVDLPHIISPSPNDIHMNQGHRTLHTSPCPLLLPGVVALLTHPKSIAHPSSRLLAAAHLQLPFFQPLRSQLLLLNPRQPKHISISIPLDVDRSFSTRLSFELFFPPSQHSFVCELDHSHLLLRTRIPVVPASRHKDAFITTITTVQQMLYHRVR